MELLPAPSIFPSVYLSHDSLDLLESGFRLRPHVVLGDFVPVFLWHLPVDATCFDLLQEVVYGHISLRLAIELGRLIPRLVDRLQIEVLDLECVEHGI